MTPDFGACGTEFTNHAVEKYSHYMYNGSVAGILNEARPTLITLQGCHELCGTGTQYYRWKDAASTISTWVLPIVGLIVQAPWESNQAFATMLMLARWLGSPIATMSYIFWNIKVTSKCALMVDMASKYHEYPPDGSEFSMMRDSIYILSIMNQYSMKPSLPPIESERLLRLVVFSNFLRLNGSDDSRDSIVYRRTQLAKAMRDGRKKGVVPVFISFLWFVFALALSIELAFNDIGGNSVAHNLAIGLLVAWLPVMVVSSTVDRNQVSADAIREQLNELVEDVRHSLLDLNTYEEYKQATKTTDVDFEWIKALHDTDMFDGNFFVGFGGQGRSHFHYGVAHPILCGIETKFMAEYGRDWLHYGAAARLAMVVGSRNDNGLKMFDARMAWQVASSIVMVCGCGFGAFILSWFTPTVGLGCRSGGYLVYMVIALGLLIIETVVWWMTHETTHTHHDLLRRIGTRLERQLTNENEKPLDHESVRRKVINYLHSNAFRDVATTLLLRPLEACNTVWLIYIIFAQTLGAYQTCSCMASTWSAYTGGFLDFQSYEYYASHGVYTYWSAGTGMSCLILALGLLYIVHEYCTQSHLSTDNYSRAMRGLKRTRWYKKHTRFVRFVPEWSIKFGKWMGEKVTRGKTRKHRRSLTWCVEYKRRIGMEVFQLRELP